MKCQIVNCENEAHYKIKIGAGAELCGTRIGVFVCKDCLLRIYNPRGGGYYSEEKENKFLREHEIEVLINFELLPPPHEK